MLRTRPTPLPAPDAPVYGITLLALLDTFSRDTYFNELAEQAPQYDATRRVKSWRDDSVDLSDPTRLITYRTVGRDANGHFALVSFALPASEAATVNLPGAVHFPAYVIEPTQATRAGSGFDAEFLSIREMATEVMHEINGQVVVDTDLPAPMNTTFPADEPRRLWGILSRNGKTLNAGELIKQKYANGIGAPGRWNLDGPEPVWEPAVIETGATDTRPPVPIPARDLFPFERLQEGTLPGAVEVIRTDRVSGATAGAVTSPTDGFTRADRGLLQQLLKEVQALRQTSGK